MTRGGRVFGVVVGNRNFFPDSLVEKGREAILRELRAMGHKTVALGTDETAYGAVETRADAVQCAALLEKHRDAIDGVIVTLPNFGDERAVAETLRLARLDVPILVHAFPDEVEKLDIGHRRDAFCGKLSLSNNLVQYGIPFTNTTHHVEAPGSEAFREDVERFGRICDVVNGLRTTRIGVLGTRPAAFNTVRYSEKILEGAGISVEPLDLAEALARAAACRAAAVRAEVERIRKYIPTKGIPALALEKMARLSLVLSEWVEQSSLDATAVQCWTAIEKLYGVVPCTAMSMQSEKLVPSACEADVMGALSMRALALAAGSPAALVDWNNNVGDDPNRVVAFHCSNLPKSLFTSPCMSFQAIIAGDVGKENTYGTCVGRIAPGPATFFRLSTNDACGAIEGYVAEGRFLDQELKTFGAYGVAEIPNLPDLLNVMVRGGFEHHAAVVKASVAGILAEALGTYLGWPLYDHTRQAR